MTATPFPALISMDTFANRLSTSFLETLDNFAEGEGDTYFGTAEERAAALRQMDEDGIFMDTTDFAYLLSSTKTELLLAVYRRLMTCLIAHENGEMTDGDLRHMLEVFTTVTPFRFDKDWSEPMTVELNPIMQ